MGLRVAAHLPQEATDGLRGRMGLGEDMNSNMQKAETVAFTLKLLRAELPPFPPCRQPTSTPEPVSHRGGQAPFRGAGLPAASLRPHAEFLKGRG